MTKKTTKLRKKRIVIASPRIFAFEIAEAELAKIQQVLERQVETLRYSDEDGTGADIVQMWASAFKEALQQK